jgi:hypothetical protein
MTGLRRWLPEPPDLGEFRFSEHGPPLTPAERASRMSDDELRAALRAWLPMLAEAARTDGPEAERARALLLRHGRNDECA